MQVSVVVVTRPAAHFGNLFFYDRDNGVVRHTTALHAIVIDDVSQPKFIHTVAPWFLKYIKRFRMREWCVDMRARALVILLIALAVAAASAFFVLRQRQAEHKPAPVAQAAVDPAISLPATLRAAVTVPIAATIEGQVESFEVEVGDEVYEGQLLARLRSSALEAEKLTAETDLERAATRVRDLEATISGVRLEASRAIADASRVRNDYQRASKDYERQRLLYAEGATPRLTYEKAEKDYHALQAESSKLDAVAAAAEERISTTQRELEAARKILEGKLEDVEEANYKVGSGDILSPVNGLVVARRGVAGDDVHPSMTDLFQIASDLSVMHAVADASPDQAARIQPGLPVGVALAEMGGEMLQGSVIKVEGMTITVEFANPDPSIKPGLTAQIRIKLP